MENIIPDGWRELDVTGGAQREIETLAVLGSELTETNRVYHAVHWTNITANRGCSVFSEIDFMAIHESANLLRRDHRPAQT